MPIKKKASTAKKNLHLGMHLIIAGSAIAVLMLLGIVDRVTFSTLPSKAALPLPATIGLEHEDPLTLSMIVARKQSAGYVSLTNRSDALIRVSMPSDWKRSEVTGAPLSAFLQDIPVFGFTRWTIPGHAGIKMSLIDAPDALFFDSNSDTTTQIDLQTIDLADLSASSRVVLLQKQTLVKLWGSEE